MDKYTIKLLSNAYAHLDEIYGYIATELAAPMAAENLLDKLEEAILSLEIMPNRFPTRRVGAYAGKCYRQLFVKNFTIVYRIDEDNKDVLIIAVRYSRSQFLLRDCQDKPK